MSIKKMLSVFLKEAETYRIQGLLDEARLKYHKALEILKELEDRKALIQIIERKVASLKANADTMELPIFKNRSPSESGRLESIDVISIEIALDAGPGKDRVLDFEVDFQVRNALSIIIPRKNKSIIAQLKDGIFLSNILYYSPIAIFRAAGVVTSCIEIKNGPKKGNYCLKIRIVD